MTIQSIKRRWLRRIVVVVATPILVPIGFILAGLLFVVEMIPGVKECWR